MNILDVLLKHFNEDLSNIFALTLWSVDHWPLWIKLIIEANNVIAKPMWFVLLVFISKAIITLLLTTTYWFSTSLKVSINHKGYSYWVVMILEFDYNILSGISILTALFLEQYSLWIASFSLLEKWLRYLRQYCFPFLCLETWLHSGLLMLFIRK